MTPPTFTVWISTRNAEPFIGKCIASLRTQTFTDYEAIFIDDVSTDRTWQAAMDAIDSDPRFRSIQNITRQRQVGSFLETFPQMAGRIIVELDGDDWFCRDDALAQILACYAGPNVQATSGRYRSTFGFESPAWVGTRRGAFNDLPATMCAPRTWLRDLTVRALAEIPEVFYGPDHRPWQSAGDLALFGPVLHMASGITSTVDAVYEVNMMNPESDWVVGQREQGECASQLIEMWRTRQLAITVGANS